MYEYKHVLLKTLSIVQENSLEKKKQFFKVKNSNVPCLYTTWWINLILIIRFKNKPSFNYNNWGV